MTQHPIPEKALDDRLGYVGTAGSGKTYNAGSGVERLLHRKSRVVTVDPLGVWYGLRLDPSGRGRGFDVVIFGGPHGDLPLTEHAGALIGETVAGMAESCILDLSELGTKASERRFMLAFLTAFYKHANGEPVHIVFDEADMWAPQKLLDREGDAAKLLGMMETIVRRGRVKGFIPWLITQRPAVLSKDVLSQVDGLVAFKLTSSQDRDAIGNWVEGQADKQQWKDIWASLPTLERGHGVIWLPSRGVLKTAQFPKKATFDSSATPKRGQKVKAGARLKPLNLGKLKERLATVEEQTKANDPVKLKAEIGNLRAEIVKLQREAGATKIDPKALVAAEKRGFERAKSEAVAAAKELLIKAAADIEKYIDPLADTMKDAIHIMRTQTSETLRILVREKQAILPTYKPAPSGPAFTGAAQPGPLQGQRAVLRTPARAKPAAPIADGEDRPLGAERKPLAALAAVHPAGMTEAQWAVAAVLKRKGGTWGTYVSRLKMSGRIVKEGDIWFATEKGIADLGGQVQTLPPPGPELVEFWAGKIPGVRPMLMALRDGFPHFLDRETLANKCNLAVGGGTFGTYLSRLRGPGLIEEDGLHLRLSPNVMGGA